MRALVEQYNQSQTGAKIVLEVHPTASLLRDMDTALRSGSGPDLAIVKSHSLGVLATSGLALPVDGLVERRVLNMLLPDARATAIAADSAGVRQMYGVPLTLDTLVLYYNRAVVPEPPATFADMLALADRFATVSEEGVPRWGMAYTLNIDKTMPYLSSFGGSVYNASGEFVLATDTRAGTLDWLEWQVQLRDNPHIVAVDDSITVDSIMKAQQAPLTIDWAHALPVYRSLWAEQHGVAPLPPLTPDSEAPQPYLQSDALVMTGRLVDEAAQVAATDFVRFLVSAEAQQRLLEFDMVPARQQVAALASLPPDSPVQVIRAQVGNARPLPNSPTDSGVVYPALSRMQHAVLRGLLSPQDALDAAAATITAASTVAPPPEPAATHEE